MRLSIQLLITALGASSLTVMFMRQLGSGPAPAAPAAQDHSGWLSPCACPDAAMELENELLNARVKMTRLQSEHTKLAATAEEGLVAAAQAAQAAAAALAAASQQGGHAAVAAAPAAAGPMDYGQQHPVTVALCLSDANEGQMDEIQVAVKSIIYQAPPAGMGAGLAIYLVAADTKSADQLKAMLNESKLDGTPWPIPVTIDVVDVSAFDREFLDSLVRLRHGPLRKFHMRHNVGAFWRLMLPWLLPESVEQTIYIDTDAWFRDTVAGMWIERDPSAMIQWGTSRTSGVMILNLKTMKAKLWPAYGSSACASLREPDAMPYFVRGHINADTGDQAFLQTIVEYLPKLESNISMAYAGIHGAQNWLLGKEWWNKFEGGAVLHNNGGSAHATWAYWRVYLPEELPNGTMKAPAHNRPVWRTAVFFADLPWHWLAYHGAILSRALKTSHPLKVNFVEAKRDRFDAAMNEAFTFWNRSLALVNATGEDCRQLYDGPGYSELLSRGEGITVADWKKNGLRGPQ